MARSGHVSGNRNKDCKVEAQVQTHVECKVSVFLEPSQCPEPLPSSTRCGDNGTAGFGVLQAEQRHSFRWWKAGEDVRI